MEILETIARNMRRRRSDLRLTQKQVADKAGIRRQNYGPLESGKKDMRITTLQKVADALEINIVELLKD